MLDTIIFVYKECQEFGTHSEAIGFNSQC